VPAEPVPPVDVDALRLTGRVPVHVAVIMDGNGRWARARGLPRFRGHAAGMRSVREVIEGAVEAGISWLTLFAFSQENWNRPVREIGSLMRLLERYVSKEREELRRQGVRVRVFGDRARLGDSTRRAIDEIEKATESGSVLRLNLMISYGGRAELARAARRLAERVAAGTLSPDSIDEATVSGELYTAGMPDPDLLIRTSGEQRISNFLLWQLAYTELYITPVLWPDFRREHLFAAIHEYQKRDRRFGRVTAG
jgi:undecaprenyl diphosphate synthase